MKLERRRIEWTAIALGAGLVVGGCAGETGPAAPAAETKPIQAIVAYVDRTRHWPQSDFRVERDPRSGFYAVIHRDDEASKLVGCDKSFEVELDPAESEVIKEWGCQ
jgi:hypothetical protein